MLFGSTEQRGTFTSAHIGRIFVSKIGGGRGGGGIVKGCLFLAFYFCCKHFKICKSSHLTRTSVFSK